MADVLLNESRRRAYLDAMQVVHWLPRTELPFAAPSNPQLLALPTSDPVIAEPAVEPLAPVAVAPELRQPIRPKVDIPRPSVPRSAAKPVEQASVAVAEVKPVPVPPPRFALQVLRAGACLVLVELVTGQPFQSRDPSYLLLKDMLRAAGLSDTPQILGEPIRWPLLQRSQLDQGPDAARDFVQGFIMAQLEQAPCACIWLVGLPAIRFAGQANAEDYNRELQVPLLGSAWAMPGLELLMDEPERKADLWKAMRGLMPRWKNRDE